MAERHNRAPDSATAVEPTGTSRPASLGDLAADCLTRPPRELAQDFAEVTRSVAGASQVVLYIRKEDRFRCHGLAPAHLESPLMAEQPSESFPWAMPSLQPRRFVLVEQAEKLPLPLGGDLGDLGLRSAVHIPLGPDSVGAIQIFWDRRVRVWDDALGAQLRAFGGFVVGRIVDPQPGRLNYGRRRTDP